MLFFDEAIDAKQARDLGSTLLHGSCGLLKGVIVLSLGVWIPKYDMFRLEKAVEAL